VYIHSLLPFLKENRGRWGTTTYQVENPEKEKTMRCPRDKSVLVGTDYKRVTIDYCPYCNGSWLDKTELAQITRKERDVLSLHEGDSIESLPTSPFSCPRCGGSLKITHYTGEKEVEIDICTGCGGIWLDTDELKEILKLASEAQ
jgi:uncharacterized protein